MSFTKIPPCKTGLESRKSSYGIRTGFRGPKISFQHLREKKNFFNIDFFFQGDVRRTCVSPKICVGPLLEDEIEKILNIDNAYVTVFLKINFHSVADPFHFDMDLKSRK